MAYFHHGDEEIFDVDSYVMLWRLRDALFGARHGCPQRLFMGHLYAVDRWLRSKYAENRGREMVHYFLHSRRRDYSE